MPPEDNKYQVGIDPIFTGQKPEDKTVPASAYNVLTNQQYSPSQNTTPPPPPSSNTASNPKSIVRTYKSDIASAIAANHLSSINIAIAENQKMREQANLQQGQTSTPENSSKSKTIMLISLTLFGLAIISLGAVFLLSGGSQKTVQVQELPALITTEFKDESNTSLIAKSKIIGTLASKLNDSQITVNNIYNTYLTLGTSTGRRLITATEFVTLMNFRMPDMLKRTLWPDFMVGMYAFGKNLPFVIFKSTSFENAYAGMLAWETDLQKDFRLLFHLPGYESGNSFLSELSPQEIKKFEDGVIVNKDVRILRDDNGEMIFLYGIIDKETIIITVNDIAFKEIINRLNKEKTLKR